MHRIPACAAVAALSTLLGGPAASAATLLAYDFEDASGAFVVTPESVSEAFATNGLEVATGTLGEVAGNPGRALLVNGFTNGNVVTLRAVVASGWRVRLTRVGFDQRASASGPDSWSLALAGSPIASGATSADFTAVSAPLDVTLDSGGLALVIGGSGASSALGTLRIDNLVLEGSATPVPLPAGLALLAVPLAALSRPRRQPRPDGRPIRATRRATGSTVRA